MEASAPRLRKGRQKKDYEHVCLDLQVTWTVTAQANLLPFLHQTTTRIEIVLKSSQTQRLM